MDNTLVQWNCRGLKANYDEVLVILSTLSPAVVCLQETYLKGSDKLSIRSYSCFNYIHDDGGRASGGCSILVNNRIPHSLINLKTPLQAVAVRVTLHQTITICSIYLPPNGTVSPSDLDNLANELPPPFILLGDLNGHNPLWGSPNINNRGKTIDTFLSNNDLCLYNDKSPTYLHPASGTFSTLDLSICSPSLFLDYEFKVHDDLCGSDHFPTILTSTSPQITDSIPRFKFSKANWELFQQQCLLNITVDTFRDVEDPIEKFANIVLRIADEYIPKTSTNIKRNRPWFNDDCKESVKERRSALRHFNSNPTPENLQLVKVYRAKARRTIRQAKKNTWHNYVSKLNSRSSIKKVWNMIRKIKGKNSSSVNHLQKPNLSTATDKVDIANTLAETFSKNSSSANYSQQFQRVKQKQEKTKLNLVRLPFWKDNFQLFLS